MNKIQKAAEFETPALGDYIQAPAIAPGAMAHSKPFAAHADH